MKKIIAMVVLLFPPAAICQIEVAWGLQSDQTPGIVQSELTSGPEAVKTPVISPQSSEQTGDEVNSFMEIETGWNGYVGTGVRFDIRLIGPLSVNTGFGIGLWGLRLSGALRLYFSYPYGLALSSGVSFNTGSIKTDVEMETSAPDGTTRDEDVSLKFKHVTVVNVSALYSWKIGYRKKIYIEAGYGFALKKNRYTYTTESGNRLSDDSKDMMDSWHPGGAIVVIGFALAL